MKLKETRLTLNFKDIQTAAMVEDLIQQLKFLFAHEGVENLSPEAALFKFLEITAKALHTKTEVAKPKIILD